MQVVPSPQSPQSTAKYSSYLSTPGASQAEILLRVTSAIALELMKAHDEGKTVNLNELRARRSKRSGYSGVPRLVDIISAVPEDYKKALLPKLKARPIRTASGVSRCLSSLC